LSQLAQIIAQMIVMRILASAFGIGAGASGGIPTNITTLPASGQANFTPGVFNFGPTGRYGGMFEPVPGYATGGIAKGREAGYPAVLHGTEAVVPLPNNRSIPVELNGNAGGTNNVTVNVNIDNEGSARQDVQSDGNMGANLGKMIAGAVQQELLNQKRAGGILNPYGVA